MMTVSNFTQVSKQDNIATVQLSRSSKLNALNAQFISEIKEVLLELERAEDVNGIILTGSETSFIVGADITEMKDLNTFSAIDFISHLQSLLGTIRHLDKPVLAAVNGHCYGAGLELAVSCDMVIASENAKFGMQEVQIGIPSVIEAAVLPFVIGLQKTRELLLTGDVIGIEEALEMGIVNYQVNHDELMKQSTKYMQKITKNPIHAVTLQKQLMNRWLENAGLELSVKAGVDFFGVAYGKEETNQALQQALK